MHDDRTLVEARIRRVVEQRIAPAVHGPAVPFSVQIYEVPGEPIGYDEAVSASYSPFVVGSAWGKPWGTAWFSLRAVVPTEWAGRSVEAVIDLGFAPHSPGFQAEASIWTAPGGPRCSVHPMRRAVSLPAAEPGTTVDLLMEAASNPGFAGTLPTPMGSRSTSGTKPIYRFRQADLCVYEREVHALVLDIEVLDGTMRTLAFDDPRRHKILRALERAIDALDLNDVRATAASARAILEPALAVPARASAHNIVAVGHAHIDTAWLWPLRETVRKCSRTFSSALELMDEYPEYNFVCSQAAQYDWMEQHYPKVFEGIKAKVAAGQWLPVGGMWVEADMNLPSGESIARQLIHGQRYFEDRFGKRCTEVWIPDVFGYPGSLPQIFAAGGCDRFITQKLSWNKQNKMPHHTFRWFGIDGTSVLTHFPPVDTYNAEIVPKELSYAQKNFADKGWSDWSLMPFGYGDGGGGPTREMLERARRSQDLDGLPRVVIGSPNAFFEAVEAEGEVHQIPEWHGELYFEMHRGTLTSQTNTKVGNRTCERLLREAELWWSYASKDDPGCYPHDTLDAIWKEVLIQQFHDIIPGSSIAWVYEDTAEVYARLVPQLEALVSEALQAVAAQKLTVANAATHSRDEVIIARDGLFDRSDTPSLRNVQILGNGEVAFRCAVPGMGLAFAEPIPSTDSVVVEGNTMRNRSVAIAWNSAGELVSMIDCATNREVFVAGQSGARIEIADDLPNEYDAWDLEAWARKSTEIVTDCVGIEVLASGPLVGRILVRRRFGASTLSQTYTVRAGSARVDIDFDIDWQEDERVLSVAFPIAVHSAQVECGIQFGSVSRPRYANTSWDAAKFEVCAHRWVDVSEADFGVAVLNNGRYGHAVQGDAVRVTLQRAPKWPDPTADRGRHYTTVSIMAHAGDRVAVTNEAELLNEPLRLVTGVRSEPAAAIVEIGDRRLEASAVKRADDRSGDLIVRLFERTGQRANLESVVASSPRMMTTDLLETPNSSASHSSTSGTGWVQPFALLTARFEV